jgi:hypothetical protein
MAEPSISHGPISSPTLGSTADQIPYVPVSWLAVGAATVAGLLAILLLLLGINSFRWHRPLLQEELIILAALAMILSFAARRVVRNSEGTRTGVLFGVDLVNTAWWIGLVLGLGYLSYYAAIEYSIRKDARNEVQAFTDLLMDGKPESLTRAFYRTQDPAQRRTIAANDTKAMEARWGKEFIAFHQCDLERLLNRNPDSTIAIGGLRDWSFKQTGVDCVFTATVTNAEGIFPLAIPLKGLESSAATEGIGRQWQVLFTPGGYIQKEQAQLTSYGWHVMYLIGTGGAFGREFIDRCSIHDLRPSAFLDYTGAKIENNPVLRPLTQASEQARNAAFSVAAGSAWRPGTEIFNYTADRLFAGPGGSFDGIAPDERKRLEETFRDAWKNVGIVKAGERLRDSADVNDQLRITATDIELSVPIEIPLTNTRGDIMAARGRLRLVCTDRALLAELKQLRESADLAQVSNVRPGSLANKAIPWKVLRVESDLKPIRMEMRPTPGGGPPGGPGGPMGGPDGP